MIQIEMSHHDMAHVVGLNPAPSLAREPSSAGSRRGAATATKGEPQAFGIGDIAGAQTGIDQNQTVFGFVQQHMANETPRSSRPPVPFSSRAPTGHSVAAMR